jgi:hypothetical protein
LIFVIPYFVCQKFLTMNLRSRSKDKDMEIISTVFAGSVISEGFGKVSTIFTLKLATKKAGPLLTLSY